MPSRASGILWRIRFDEEVFVNQNHDRRQKSIELLRDYMGGRIDRRQLLKSAAAAGVLLPQLVRAAFAG